MLLKKEDLAPIIEHLNRRKSTYNGGDTYLVKQLKVVMDKSQSDQINIQDVQWIYGKESLQDGHLQNLLYQLGEKYGTPYPKFLETELMKNSWGGEKLVTYTKFIKNKEYYPSDDKIIADVIKNNSSENNRIFKALITLSSLIKDNNNACDAFSFTMAKKSRFNPLPLLELDKIQTLFNKRFKGVDVNSLPTESYNTMKEIFARIEEKASSDCLSEDEGHFFRVKIDLDSLSQKDKLTIGKVSDGVRRFIYSFSCFVESKSEMVEKFSLYDFQHENLEATKQTELTFFYKNLEMKDILLNTIRKLLDNGLTKGEDKDITFVDIFSKHDDTDEFYESYFRKELLEKELNQKGTASKKMKI